MRIDDATSLLLVPEQHPLLPPETVTRLGATVIFAPHPDDETLACGGLLALLAEFGCPVHVVVITDGSRSHPDSTLYPGARLVPLREQETTDALTELGVAPQAARFLRYPDCGLPERGTAPFTEVAARLRRLLIALAPDTIVVPWRRDPHCDHEATWHLLRAAMVGPATPPRWLEYPVWAWTQADSEVAPQISDGLAWRLAIPHVLARKQRAIARHRSQTGALIDDDPAGFVLTPSTLAYFTRPWELFIEPSDV